MNCSEARKLIDQGVLPGSSTPLRASLTFHLNDCPQCRAYREERLLVLNRPDRRPGRKGFSALAVPSEAPKARQPRTTFADILWISSILLLLSLPLLGLFKVVSILAHSSVKAEVRQALLVPSPSAFASPTPSLSPAPTQKPSPLPTWTTTRLFPSFTPTSEIPTLEVSASPTEIVTEDATILALATAEEELAKTAQATLLPSLTPTSADSPALWPTIQTLLLTASPQPEWPTPLPAPSLPPISLAPNPQPNTNPTLRAPAATSPTLTLPQLRPTIPDGELLTGTNELPSNSTAVTLLLLGHDRRPGESDLPRTDAMLLVRLDLQKGRIALFSLPRDLWTEIPGHGFGRINSAYPWGEMAKIPGGGLGLTRETVSKLLGIPVDYAIMIGFEGFVHLVDQIDGITVNVDRELYDDQFPTMDYKYTIAHFRPGPQIMDGVRALTYGRIRHPDSDFMRILRQQVLLLAIGARLRERGDLQTSLTLGQTVERLTSLVETDLPKARALELAWAFRDFDLANAERYALSESTVSFGVGNDSYALVPSQPDLDHLTKLFLGSAPPN